MGLCQDFYNKEAWREVGFTSLGDFLYRFWEAAEQKLIPNSKFRVVDSLWAHFAMFCMSKSDRDQIDSCIRDLLAEPVG
jgi:hypothetical protein